MGKALSTCCPYLRHRIGSSSSSCSSTNVRSSSPASLSSAEEDVQLPSNINSVHQSQLSLPYVVEQHNNTLFRQCYHQWLQQQQQEQRQQQQRWYPECDAPVFSVVIEGNIGCGKSEILFHIERNYDCSVVYEPVNEWQCFGSERINYLQKFYENPKKYAFLFQNLAQFTRMQICTKKDSTQKALCFIERGLESVITVFSKVLQEEGLLSWEEYSFLKEQSQAYNKIYNTSKIPVLYIRTDPLNCFERIRQRGRPEERNVSTEYLRKLHSCYDQWLLNNTISPIVIDGNKALVEVCEYFDKIVFPTISNAANIYYNQQL
jgi:deoxyadenosine/deoxycytidine kinase